MAVLLAEQRAIRQERRDDLPHQGRGLGRNWNPCSGLWIFGGKDRCRKDRGSPERNPS